MKRLIVVVWMACAFAAAAPPRAAAESKAAETKAEYVKKARAEIDELGGKIDALESKAEKTGASTRAGMDRSLKELKARRKTAKKKLAKLKRASGDAWTDLKAGVDKGIEDLKNALDEAVKG